MSFHLSLPVKSLEVSISFFEKIGGDVTHRDESGYVNVALFGCQITIREVDDFNFYLPEFHFGFNTSRDHFEKIAKMIKEENPELIKMAPKTIDAGTAMERRKMYLNSPSGYLVEIKGVNQ